MFFVLKNKENRENTENKFRSSFSFCLENTENTENIKFKEQEQLLETTKMVLSEFQKLSSIIIFKNRNQTGPIYLLFTIMKLICKTQQNSSLLLMLLLFMLVAECRVLLMTIAEEIMVPLRSLVEATWTAKHLYTAISGKDL